MNIVRVKFEGESRGGRVGAGGWGLSVMPNYPNFLKYRLQTFLENYNANAFIYIGYRNYYSMFILTFVVYEKVKSVIKNTSQISY
jgi:hypothetical protein